jgi:predicted ribosome quality control (RQC) complex YloA/Tae2 family protein
METSPKIFIGKNAKDNWDLLDNACEDDLWFHVKDESSAYVIIENNYKDEITKEDIENACIICKNNSKLRNHNKRVAIIWLPVKYVLKGKVVGQAKLTKEPKISYV